VLPVAFFETVTNLKARIEAPKRGDENLIPIDVSWQQENLLLDQPLSADIPLVVDYILQKSQEQGASDIHLEPTEEVRERDRRIQEAADALQDHVRHRERYQPPPADAHG
jgi:type II secretory ATPase GspE/PulE/Tfp pilus assembly ATPase PilB-like protein